MSSSTTPRQPPNAPFLLVPPELFSIVTDAAPHPIYRCSSVSPENRSFLKTLNLKTIVSLTAEKPSKPLRAISEEQGIKLVHLGLWHPSTWEAYQPLSKGAVEKSLRLLTIDNLPALLVDDGHGMFVGVLRKLMGWNHTSIILEYRAFAGNHPRYGNEEFIEMVDTSRINIPEGIDFLTWYGPRSHDGVKGSEKGPEDKEKGEIAGGTVGALGTTETAGTVRDTAVDPDGVTQHRHQEPENLQKLRAVPDKQT